MITFPKFDDSIEQIQFYDENRNILLIILSHFLKSLYLLEIDSKVFKDEMT